MRDQQQAQAKPYPVEFLLTYTNRGSSCGVLRNERRS